MAATSTSHGAEPAWLSARLGAAPGPLLFVVAALGYLAMSQLVIWFDDPIDSGASLWPGAGLAVAMLMLAPTRRWVWVLAGVGVAELAGDLAWGYPLGETLGFVLGNTVGPLVGAAALRRVGNTRGELSPAASLLQFLGCAVALGPAVGASLGFGVAELSGAGWAGGAWVRWLIGDALGVLVVAPLLLARPAPTPAGSVVERVALTVGGAATTVLVFSNLGGAWQATLPYLVVPFFMWTALRLGSRATAVMALGVAVVADVATAWGLGPFAIVTPNQTLSAHLVQMFLVSTVASALLLAAVTQDLRVRRRTESVLRHQALHDPLTGLPNRLMLDQRLAEADQAAAESSDGMLVCDLDGLKGVNDRFGHREGDRLLVEVAHRLQAAVRPGDLVVRISGDEFVVLVDHLDPGSLVGVAHRILEAMHRTPVLVGGHEVVPSLSVGAAHRLPGQSSDSLFRRADAALYESKRRGRGTVVLADELAGRRAEQPVWRPQGHPDLAAPAGAGG